MIVTETKTIGGRELIYTYSDAGCYVVRDGISYLEAYDPVGSNRVYTEGDIIETEEATTEDYIEALGRLGVVSDEEA